MYVGLFALVIVLNCFHTQWCCFDFLCFVLPELWEF